MAVCELGYLGLGVRDLDAWQRLATAVLGLQVGGRGSDGALYLRCDERHHRIALHPSSADEVRYLGWQVPGPAEFEAMLAELRAAGVDARDATADELASRKAVRMVRFTDPAGYPSELFHGPLVPASQPFHPSRPMSGFRTAGLGLGHVLVFADDVATMERFYVDRLGFKVTDYALRGSVFLRCNPRHHSFGVSAAGKGPRINHLMIETLSIDDVGRALDLCEAEGFPIVASLGRHTNDHMVSFYVDTPSGFHIEYGCMGRLIDDATWTVHVNDWGDALGHKRVQEQHQRAMRVDPAKTPFAHMIAKERVAS